MNIEKCPTCGEARAWSGWRCCPCGYDFGPNPPPRRPVAPPPLPSRTPPLPANGSSAQIIGVLIVLGVFASIMLGVLIVWQLPRSPGLADFIEHSIGPVTPSSVYVGYLDSPNSVVVMSGLYWLTERKDPAGVPRALKLLESTDDYIWMDAAHYVGTCDRSEAVPYLIKALRHTAWRSDAERVKILQKLTGKGFGNDFSQWQQWWISTSPETAIDWESHLGFRPRISGMEAEKRANN